MSELQRLEGALEAVLSRAAGPGAPPLLSKAIRHAVFPGGARIRPRLCFAVAAACGDDRPEATDAAAVSIELLHCASLVHDDLPCFDDAPTRRGKPSVHRAFGEDIAVLAGDALIVLAFESLARGAACAPERLSALLATVSRGVGTPGGIVAGQAWEAETDIVLADYQRAKTGALFAAATEAGAAAAGADGEPWAALGLKLGEAYQVADDLRDVLGDAKEIGKPTGRDAALGRPNAVCEHGIAGAVECLKDLISVAVQSIPNCQGVATLRRLIQEEAKRFLPKEITARAA